MIDVASTSNNDTNRPSRTTARRRFGWRLPAKASSPLIPWGTYAAGWGTSFSTPLVAGTAALMMGSHGNCPALLVRAGLARCGLTSAPRSWASAGWIPVTAVQACHMLLIDHEQQP